MEKNIMSDEKKHSICPVEKAGILDFGFRRLLQNPGKILRPYVAAGMTALDLGCGPGFFTLEMARLVGPSGRVTAADLQEGMLGKLKAKIQGTALADRIRFHRCLPDRIGLAEKFDFILVFYMLHEVPDQAGFIQEIASLLRPGGRILIVEPKFHVAQDDFQKSIGRMEKAGLSVLAEPGIRFSRAVVIGNAGANKAGSRS
jgi:ubiquinone/menaquinone biosynthesis C-methylase UbiE